MTTFTKVSGLATRPHPPQKELPAALAVVNLRDFAIVDLPRIEYVIEGMLPRGYVTLLGGHGGAGKSFLGLVLLAHVASGQSWAGLNVAQGRAVYISLEDSANVVVRRLRKIAETYRLDIGAIELNLVVVDGTISDGVLATVIDSYGAKAFTPTAAFEELRKVCVGASLIVIDNASDAFDGNENDRRSVRAFMRLLARLARENDAAVVLLAHIDKHAAKYGAAGNTYSGSTAWHNSARSRLALIAGHDGTIELRHEKNNHGKLAAPVELRWNADGVLVPGMASTRATTGRDVVRDATDDAGVLAALRAAQIAGQDVIANRMGSNTAQIMLSTFADLPEVLRGSRGRNRFWAAVDRLTKDKRAALEQFQNSNRKSRTRLVLTSAPHSTPPYTPSESGALGCAPLSPALHSTAAQSGAGEVHR